jgi:hypothetical protein
MFQGGEGVFAIAMRAVFTPRLYRANDFFCRLYPLLRDGAWMAYRQSSAGAMWVRIASITWAL